MGSFRTFPTLLFLPLGFLLLNASATFASDDPSPPVWQQVLDNDYYKISLNVRARMELADRENFGDSEAFTVRTRAGIGTKPFYGFSAFGEVENTAVFNDDAYFNVRSAPNRRGLTPIAEPENTELNRAWVQYENADLLGLKIKGGRQRIVFDDSRFVGNVGWRQNEQTYDAVLAKTNFGLENVSATYGFIWDVKRIFGRKGPNFDSESHIANVKFGGLPGGASITAFAYLLDFRSDSAGNSSNTFGARLTGKTAINETFTALYSGSYAYQTDAGDNPVDYITSYFAAEGGLATKRVGALKVGYELLGSDDGTARFVTPLATAHKFNGFADVFLNNGGGNGLQDLYVTAAPKLPFGLGGAVTYHRFWSDEESRTLGDEVDFVLKRAFGPHVTALTKGAYFFSDTPGLDDIWRYWFEVTLNF